MPLPVHHKHPLLTILWLKFPCLSPSCHTIVAGFHFLPLHCGHGGKCRDFQNSDWQATESATRAPLAAILSLACQVRTIRALIVLPGLCICATRSLPSLFPAFLVASSCTCLGIFSTFPQWHPEVDHSASVLLASRPGASLRPVQLV